jgi:hypothetical protein
MKIKNIEGLTAQQLQREVESGGKFVFYQYTISIIVLTFKQSSDIYFIRPGEQAWIKGLPFTVLTLLLGWWGFPWGPIYSIGSLYQNLSGGEDVTQEILAGQPAE